MTTDIRLSAHSELRGERAVKTREPNCVAWAVVSKEGRVLRWFVHTAGHSHRNKRLFVAVVESDVLCFWASTDTNTATT